MSVPASSSLSSSSSTKHYVRWYSVRPSTSVGPTHRNTRRLTSTLTNHADVYAEMEKAIKQMPLSKWEQWSEWETINPLLLTFTRQNWEIWMHFVWNRCKDPHDEHEGHIPQPKNKLLQFMYQTSIKVVWSALLRTTLYLIITIMLAICAMFDMLFECENIDRLANNNATSSIAESRAGDVDCISSPWQMTETCSLAILTSFLFLRVYFILKLIIGIIIVSFYTWNITNYRSAIFDSGDTWHPQLEPKIAHILNVTFLTFSLHLIDRQAEYLSRLDYQWKRQLTQEQDEAFHTRNANKLLPRNAANVLTLPIVLYKLLHHESLNQ